MKVKADVTIEIDEKGLAAMGEDFDFDLTRSLVSEVSEAIRNSERWRDLRRAVYHSVLAGLREQLVKDFALEKVKNVDEGMTQIEEADKVES